MVFLNPVILVPQQHATKGHRGERQRGAATTLARLTIIGLPREWWIVLKIMPNSDLMDDYGWMMLNDD